MRMVFTNAPDEMFYPARERLVSAFEGWARRQRRSVDPFVVAALVEHRWATGDGILCRWQPSHLRTALRDWFPRRVTLPSGEWQQVLPTVHAFIDFLFAEDLADARCAEAGRLHATLDDIADDFDTVMGDQTRYGPAKFWAMRMLAAGVDPTDSEAAMRYIGDVQSGQIVVDQKLLNQVMVNQLMANDGPPPPLPMVSVPDDATLTKLAAESVALVRIRRFVDWVGAGRTLTATNRLRLADARELIAALELADVVDPQIGNRVFKTKSSEELYETSVVFAWARAARVVRLVKGRLVPVKSAARLLTDPLALAHRAFEGFFTLGEAICGSGWAESMIRWRFDDVSIGLMMGLCFGQPPVHMADLYELAWDSVNQGFIVTSSAPQANTWRKLCDNDVDRLLNQLGDLGAVELDGEEVRLTPLGIGLFTAHLKRKGIPVPTLQELLDETAEVVIANAAELPLPVREELLNRWAEQHPDTARADLTALAERTDDRLHRKLAQDFARHAGRR